MYTDDLHWESVCVRIDPVAGSANDSICHTSDQVRERKTTQGFLQLTDYERVSGAVQ